MTADPPAREPDAARQTGLPGKEKSGYPPRPRAGDATTAPNTTGSGDGP
jgi:hypothetical protein